MQSARRGVSSGAGASGFSLSIACFVRRLFRTPYSEYSVGTMELFHRRTRTFTPSFVFLSRISRPVRPSSEVRPDFRFSMTKSRFSAHPSSTMKCSGLFAVSMASSMAAYVGYPSIRYSMVLNVRRPYAIASGESQRFWSSGQSAVST